MTAAMRIAEEMHTLFHWEVRAGPFGDGEERGEGGIGGLQSPEEKDA